MVKYKIVSVSKPVNKISQFEGVWGEREEKGQTGREREREREKRGRR